MSTYLYLFMIDHHPCKHEATKWGTLPKCLTDDYGKCELDEHALYCPKYGSAVGYVKRWGHLIVEETKDEEVSE